MWEHTKADDTHCSLIPDIGLMLISTLVVSVHSAQFSRVLHGFLRVLQGIAWYGRASQGIVFGNKRSLANLS